MAGTIRVALFALMIILGVGGCASLKSDSEQIAACERSLLVELKAPSTYNRLSADGLMIKENKPPYFMVAIEYDAANSYGTPIRNKKFCS